MITIAHETGALTPSQARAAGIALKDLVQAVKKHVTARPILVTWAADCAGRVLPLYEAVYPSDCRPRMAVSAARTVTDFAQAVIDNAAWAAADDASRANKAAANNAAWTAAAYTGEAAIVREAKAAAAAAAAARASICAAYTRESAGDARRAADYAAWAKLLITGASEAERDWQYDRLVEPLETSAQHQHAQKKADG